METFTKLLDSSSTLCDAKWPQLPVGSTDGDTVQRENIVSRLDVERRWKPLCALAQ